jgi:hypothetical protein
MAKQSGREKDKKKGDKSEQDPRRSLGGNQGEGNREADRRYREGASEFARSGRAEPAAREARRAVDAEEEELEGRERYDADDLDDQDEGRHDVERALPKAGERSRQP